jgi:hypothetical protein
MDRSINDNYEPQMEKRSMKRQENRRAIRQLRAASLATLTLSSALLVGCGGGEGQVALPGPPPGTPTQALFAFYTEAGEKKVARINPVTLEVLETAAIPFGAPGGKQKSYFYEDRYVWTANGPNVFGFDPQTLNPVLGQVGPYVQASRSGEVSLGRVNNVGVVAASLDASPMRTVYGGELTNLLQQSTWSDEQWGNVDLCSALQTVNQSAQALVTALTVGSLQLTEDDVRFHNMGYGPVGLESSPDGKLLMFAVRQGDHILFLDTDPDSDTFGKPVRFVHPAYGTVKDYTNAVVGTFTSQYAVGGGTAPGDLRWTRGTGVQDIETLVEPCDSTMLRNHEGVVWSWTVDVDGDTITGVNVDRIYTDAPEVHNLKVSVVRKRNFTANRVSAGPWMGSLVNRNAGNNEFLLFIEYEGENAEGVWNITNAGSAFEVQRMFNTLADVVDTPPPAGTPFVNGQLYPVTISFDTTGGPSEVVQYRYVSLPGDNGTGASAPNIGTTAYLQKVTATDPGPNFLLNGLTGRAFTSGGTMSRLSGSGENTTVYSDEVWLTTQGNLNTTDGFDIVNLRTSVPWLINDRVQLPSTAGHWYKDKYFQARAGGVDVIDRDSRSLVNVIRLGDGVQAIAFGTYSATLASAGNGGPGGGGGGGGGGGVVLPSNPCGG